MSAGKRDEREFLHTLSHDLASEVFEDEQVCEEALKLGGPDAETAVSRIRERAARALAEQRRARVAAFRQAKAQPSARTRRYDSLSRDELLSLIEARSASVEHRDLRSAPDEDLRTLLEDLDALENDDEQSQE